ncbi:hypothetical protein [Paraflavitalea speifideaquila]|uniref:hypothetical protein n=1 Tax=Paraflavitalea speifideaquila TaxID=3076558 RepID=UPI0028EB135D|nr:hypothetical protein [Paraflavitalea speifideiaquila]
MRHFLAVCCFFLSSYAQAQNIALNNSVTNIITQSTPQAYQFQKYGDMPVNTSTGTATVQVPLFKIGIKNVDWDISLSYQTQGIKVSELSGCVGLGWNLQAPGMISSRSLQQSDVFVNNEGDNPAYKKTFVLGATGADPQLGACSYVNPQDNGFVTNMMAARENEDSRNIQNFMPDVFYLSAGSLNAKFFLKNHKGYCMPSKDISIEHFSTPSHHWIVKDEQGNKYTFELSGGNASNFYWPNNIDLEGPG